MKKCDENVFAVKRRALSYSLCIETNDSKVGLRRRKKHVFKSKERAEVQHFPLSARRQPVAARTAPDVVCQPAPRSPEKAADVAQSEPSHSSHFTASTSSRGLGFAWRGSLGHKVRWSGVSGFGYPDSNGSPYLAYPIEGQEDLD